MGVRVTLSDTDYGGAMKPARKFVVVPSLPDKLRQLWDLAYNLWWCWNPEAIEMFRRIDRDLWEQIYHNPVAMLGVVSPERLEQLATDDGFLVHAQNNDPNYSRFIISNFVKPSRYALTIY